MTKRPVRQIVLIKEFKDQPQERNNSHEIHKYADNNQNSDDSVFRHALINQGNTYSVANQPWDAASVNYRQPDADKEFNSHHETAFRKLS